MKDNPYNPFGLIAEFKVNVIDDDKFDEIKNIMRNNYKVQVDDILAVEVIPSHIIINQGCLNDDKTILGGKNEFLSHFCTFFNFNICYSAKENKAARRATSIANDPEELNKRVEDFVKKFDDIK